MHPDTQPSRSGQLSRKTCAATAAIHATTAPIRAATAAIHATTAPIRAVTAAIRAATTLIRAATAAIRAFLSLWPYLCGTCRDQQQHSCASYI
jgi:hypothetical protein